MRKNLHFKLGGCIIDYIPLESVVDNDSLEALSANNRIIIMVDIFKLSWKDVLSALVSAIIGGIFAMGVYVLKIGNIFSIDIHSMINVGAIALITGIVALIQAFLTTSDGNVVGLIPTK